MINYKDPPFFYDYKYDYENTFNKSEYIKCNSCSTYKKPKM